MKEREREKLSSPYARCENCSAVNAKPFAIYAILSLIINSINRVGRIRCDYIYFYLNDVQLKMFLFSHFNSKSHLYFGFRVAECNPTDTSRVEKIAIAAEHLHMPIHLYLYLKKLLLFLDHLHA